MDSQVSNVIKLFTEQALACNCGSVSWYYLKSNKLRCINCGHELHVEDLRAEVVAGSFD